MDINNITISGRLTKDAFLSKNGNLMFTLATGRDKYLSFIPCVLTNKKIVEYYDKFLNKGIKVVVNGYLSVKFSKETKQNTIALFINTIVTIGKGGETEEKETVNQNVVNDTDAEYIIDGMEDLL